MTKKLTVVFGIVFVLIGLLGFIPNSIVGPGATFETDAIHNVVHLLIGAILLFAASKGESTSALWLKVFGVVYLVLFLNGLIQSDMLLGFVKANSNDIWFHLVSGVVLLVAGFMGGKKAMVMNSMTL